MLSRTNLGKCHILRQLIQFLYICKCFYISHQSVSKTSHSLYALNGECVGVRRRLILRRQNGEPYRHIASKVHQWVSLSLLTCISLFLNYVLGINTYGWRQAGVNHVLIFELNPRNNLSHQHLFEV